MNATLETRDLCSWNRSKLFSPHGRNFRGVVEIADESRQRMQLVKVMNDGAAKQVAHGRVRRIRPVPHHWKRAARRPAENQHVLTPDPAGLQHHETLSLEGMKRVRDRHAGGSCAVTWCSSLGLSATPGAPIPSRW